MLFARNGNGVLDAGTITNMLSHAYSFRTHKGPDGKASHGYHGMDWVSDIDSGNDQWEFSKDGWLPGQGSSLTGTAGGFFYVYLQNGNTPGDATMELWDNLVPLAEAHNWGTTDLFPGLGLPAFPTFTFKALKNGADCGLAEGDARDGRTLDDTASGTARAEATFVEQVSIRVLKKCRFASKFNV